MKKLSALFLSSLLLLPSLSLAVVKPSAAQTPPTQKSAASLEQLAQKVTVKITSPNSQGSGVIIGKRGNNYTVITNAHVIHRQDAYQIQTADGQ
jgi:S1-C subfamily serine protease